jgi:NitT/TauT family transport system permease protein
MTLFGKKVPPIFSLVLWMILWEVIGRSNLIIIIPPLSSVLRATTEVVRVSTFYNDVMGSLKSFLLGLGLSMGIGIPMGFLMGRFQKVDEMLSTWVNIFISAPVTALVPIIMVIFGIGERTVTVTVFMFSLWPLVLDTRAGVRHINTSLIEMARVFGATPAEVCYKIMFWAALPEILVGLKLSVIRGVRGVIVGQLLLAVTGLGRLCLTYSEYFLMDKFFALLLFILAFAWGLSSVVSYLERKVERFAKGR